MNILFSTTKMWNPGDEVILQGVTRLFEGRFGQVNVIPWNRNPGVNPGNMRFDNSFDLGRHSLDALDYVVFAGSPEWMGPRVQGLLDALSGSKLRCSFVGIGSSHRNQKIDTRLRSILKNQTDLVTCRDRETFQLLNPYVSSDKIFLLPCPSIMHNILPRKREKLSKIGINYQTNKTKWHLVPENVKDRAFKTFQEIVESYDYTVICNYIDDFDEALTLFDPSKVRFSSDVLDFFKFFDEVDFLVGTRVHGCLGATGCGAPAMLLDSKDDLRRAGVFEQIPVLLSEDRLREGGVKKFFDSFDVTQHSSEIFEWIESTRKRYQDAISHVEIVPRKLPTKRKVDDAFPVVRWDNLVNSVQIAPSVVKDRYRKFLATLSGK